MPSKLDFDPYNSGTNSGGLDFDPYSEPTQATPAAPAIARPDRSWVQAATDTYKGVATGVGNVISGAGTLYGLATGDMDNAATRFGGSVRDYWQERQSDALKADKAARSAAIDQADGILGKAGTAIKETIKNPSLLADTVAENIATFIPAAGAARVGSIASKAAGATAATAARVGTGAGIGVGAVQQGADVAQGAYDAAIAKPDAVWNTNAEYAKRVAAGESPDAVKHSMALESARIAMPAAAAVSVATQFLPGASMAERFAAGATAKAAKVGGKEVGGLAGRAVNAAKGVAGEGAQEALEEGGGQFAANLTNRNIDQNQSLSEGVGESAGMGFVGGAGLGGIAGAAQRPRVIDDVLKQEGVQKPVQPPSQNAGTSGASTDTSEQPSGVAEPLGGDIPVAGSATVAQPATLLDGSPVPDPSAGPLSRSVNVGVESGAVPVADPFDMTDFGATTSTGMPPDGFERLGMVAQGLGLDPEAIVAAARADMGDDTTLDTLDDRILATYAQSLGAANGPAQEVAGPVQERPELAPVGGALDAPAVASAGQDQAGSGAAEATSLPATTAGREAAGADDVGGAQAKEVSTATNAYPQGVAESRDAPKSLGSNYGDRPGDSWVLRNKETGEVIAETYDRAKVDALNTDKYEAVPALQHLQEVNTDGTKAYANARELPATAAQAPQGSSSDQPGTPAPRTEQPAPQNSATTVSAEGQSAVAPGSTTSAEAMTGRGAAQPVAPSGTQAQGGTRANPLPATEMDRAPVGAWVSGPDIPGVAPADAARQVMDVPIDQIDATEFTSGGKLVADKQADADRYAEAMRNGEQFPNARGSVLPNGKIKLQDGHRRLAAAIANGQTTLRIAVNPMPATPPTSTPGPAADQPQAASRPAIAQEAGGQDRQGAQAGLGSPAPDAGTPQAETQTSLDPSPQSATAEGGVQDGLVGRTLREAAADAPWAKDLNGGIVGWKVVEQNNGNVVHLVNADNNRSITFTNPNPKSGTEARRNYMNALAWAVDNPTAISSDTASEAAAQAGKSLADSASPATQSGQDGAQSGQVDEAAVRAAYAEAMSAKQRSWGQEPDHDWASSAGADRVVAALNRDPVALEELAAGGKGVQTGRAVFAKLAGITLPRSLSGQKAALDAWAGITPQQRAAGDKAKANAKQAKREQEIAARRDRTPIPDFKDAAEANRWWRNRAEAFPSQGAYRATPEYAEFVEKTKDLYAQGKAKYLADRAGAMEKAGIKAGDRVETSQVGAFFQQQKFTGTVVMRGGEPWVKLDGKVTTSKKGRVSEASSVRWTPAWTKVDGVKAKPAPSVKAEPVAAPTADPAIEAAIAEYGYTLKDGKFVTPSGKETSVSVAVSKGRARVLRPDGSKLWIGTPANIGKFLESFWMAEKKKPATPAPSVKGEGNERGNDNNAKPAHSGSAVARIREQFLGEKTDAADAVKELREREARIAAIVQKARDAGVVDGALVEIASGRNAGLVGEVRSINPVDGTAGVGIENGPVIYVELADLKPAPTAGEGKETAKPAANTEDAGEELWANRRNSTGKGLQWTDIQDINPTLKAREVVKTKVWPRPNYEQLIEGGIPAPVARIIKSVYDAIATKPQSAKAVTDEDYQAYIAGVQKLRDAAFAWARAAMEKAPAADNKDVVEFGEKHGLAAKDVAALVGVMLKRGGDGSMLDAVFPYDAQTERSRFRAGTLRTNANNDLALLLGGRKLTGAMQVIPQDIMAAIRDVQNGWPSPQEAWEKSYTIHEDKVGDRKYRNGQTVTITEPSFWIASKQGRFNLIVAEGFKTREEAAAAAKALYEKKRKKGSGGTQSEAPVKLQDTRDGAARRQSNEDITSDKLIETFGFKGVNFGNWMKGASPAKLAERQAHLNNAYDSMLDLAEILNIPPKAISLNGMLGLAIGAQGHGGRAAAHFVPGVNEINLTREQGAGSLAHEWAHALDHYFATLAGAKVATGKAPYLTEHTTDKFDGVRPEVQSAFKAIVSAMRGRDMTAEEMEAQERATMEGAKSALKRHLASMRSSLESATLKAGRTREDVLASFDELAERLRRGDLGEGYLKHGKGFNDNEPQVVALVAMLYRESLGYKYGDITSLGWSARRVAEGGKARESNKAHIPQVPSNYRREALKLDKGFAGKYWSTNLEMFARAFQSYVLDRLAAQGARNDYLTRPQMDEETIKVAQEMGIAEDGDRYPRQAERAAINAAFDTLVGAVRTRETDTGIALESVEGLTVEDDAQPTDAEAAAFDRQSIDRKGLREKLSREQGEADADANWLRSAVQKVLGASGNKVVFLRGIDGLPENVRGPQERAAAQRGANMRTAGLFHPKTNTVYLFTDVVKNPQMAAFTASHEIAGHLGLRALLGNKLNSALDRAVTNKTVRAVAESMTRQRNLRPDQRHLAIEEALADLAAAQRTGNYDRIKEKHGVEVPTTMRSGLRATIARFIEAVRNLFRTKDARFSDAQVRQLLENAWKAAQVDSAIGTPSSALESTEGGSLEGMDLSQTKVVDADGKPLTVFHGTTSVIDGSYRIPAFFSESREGAEWFAQDGGTVNTAKLDIRNPLDISTQSGSFKLVQIARKAGVEIQSDIADDGKPWDFLAPEIAKHSPYDGTNVADLAYIPKVRAALQAAGFDGLKAADPLENGDHQVWVAFDAAQIAQEPNEGSILESVEDGSVASALANALGSVRDVKLPAGYMLSDFLNGQQSKALHWWHRSVGTMYNLAQRSPLFKQVFDRVQDMVADVSHYANSAMDLAPDILPKFDSMRDALKKKPMSAADAKKVSAALFDGTLKWARDANGDIIPSGGIDKAGVVWTDEELASRFGMDERQRDLYRQTRRAIDKSLDDTATTQMLRFMGEDGLRVREEVLQAATARQAANIIQRHIADMLSGKFDLKADGRESSLEETSKRVMEVAAQVDKLKSRGYAPLSRFGRFTVYKDGENPIFLMFETQREANRAARKLSKQYGSAVRQGTMSQEQFKLFKGMTPETLELFGEMLGLDATGNEQDDLIFQTFIKAAKSNRSALKRLIHREGVAGYSEDVPRVLASFLYSNARLAATNLHAANIQEAIQAIPKEEGDLKDAAIRLNEYIVNPDDAGAFLQSFNFAQFLGGSIASAMVNMTQPLTMSFPWLSQYGGAWKAARALAEASKLAVKNVTTGNHLLDDALKRADADGHTQPQEVHQLQAYADGRGVLRAGDGTKAGDAAAKAYNAKARIMLAWGLPFSLAEQFNRRTTFIAAWNTAVEQGMADPYGFAVQAVQATQGIYNKANKPQWSRNAIGGMAFTFKQYSINYVEMLHRMWVHGGKEGKQGVLLAVAVMFLLAGAGGLPGADDLDDLLDGLMQRLGYNFSSKQAREEFFASLIGEQGAKFMEHGLSSIPGMPIDVSGRLGMGNLLPSTGLLVRKEDHSRDIAEIAGPTGDIIKRTGESLGMLAEGKVGASILNIAPRAVSNAWKGVEMASTGEYRDTKGRKVIDTTPGEAAAKLIGFQPATVAKVQQASGKAYDLLGNYRVVAADIADRWAKGIHDGDADAVAEAQQDLAEWNAKNPDMPIRISRGSLQRRVFNLRLDRRQRLAKTTPKAVRSQVEAMLDDTSTRRMRRLAERIQGEGDD